MNSVFWFLIGVGFGFVLFDQPQYIADVGNWLVEQSQKISSK
jgi:hypothetical protein